MRSRDDPRPGMQSDTFNGRDRLDDVVPVLLHDMTGSRQLVQHPQLVGRHHRRAWSGCSARVNNRPYRPG